MQGILGGGTPALDKAIELRDKASTKWVETLNREPMWKMGLLERIKEIRTGAGGGGAGQLLGGFGLLGSQKVQRAQRTQYTPPSPSPITTPIKTYTAPIKTY